ncbi:hypothetical protein ElyMa_003703000 [Elysia marginata]|uniref:Uncharacterized protein n=1 Tax=Elysia marginata TaxID=1093978 RepID=A0AAV4F235_9GAST|nr:hypothetical protein ElyMa_003703000 [Elysia marginata]
MWVQRVRPSYVTDTRATESERIKPQRHHGKPGMGEMELSGVGLLRALNNARYYPPSKLPMPSTLKTAIKRIIVEIRFSKPGYFSLSR